MKEIPDKLYRNLVNLAEARLPPDEHAQVMAQVHADPSVAKQLTYLEELIGLMRYDEDEGENAPAHVVNRAKRLLRPIADPQAPSLLRRVMAMLSFDSAQAPLMMGVRSGYLATRQMLFNAEERDLDLRISAAGTLWAVSGQVLGVRAGGHVELQDGSRAVQADLNDLSEFALPPVPPGNYTLTLRQNDVEIMVTDLDVGPSSET
ncbi:MAG: hypothetical protein MI924_23800 [Chloroflexales bacterium]|nr:hypothetical protein [Chloroflexales bacterium]